jgi:hypothetical protein
MSDRNGHDGEGGGGGAFAELDPEIAPSPEVEERIVASLAARGLVRRRRPSFAAAPRFFLSAAAAAVLFLAGVLVGSHRGATEPREGKFALFLSPLAGERAEDEPARVLEYRAWASRIRESGRYVSGEKLERGGRIVSPPGTRAEQAGGAALLTADAPESLAGYFVVTARSLAEAVDLARTCPHVRHGGTVTVRAIAPV